MAKSYKGAFAELMRTLDSIDREQKQMAKSLATPPKRVVVRKAHDEDTLAKAILEEFAAYNRSMTIPDLNPRAEQPMRKSMPGMPSTMDVPRVDPVQERYALVRHCRNCLHANMDLMRKSMVPAHQAVALQQMVEAGLNNSQVDAGQLHQWMTQTVKSLCAGKAHA
ncbi:hypothetical protein H0K60_004494 [Salmonella enterica]|nr:hypothetical protein [Salmonella enterica]EFR2649736.1 hypothetical protein [Salmonella enterica]EFS1408085.1 hypothetical protein [Salmonella enterica]EHQ8162533.1 hypothetical protein [Salmonella enterica]EJZ9218186.1 hypothetical protein [Salmonella enterica]